MRCVHRMDRQILTTTRCGGSANATPHQRYSKCDDLVAVAVMKRWVSRKSYEKGLTHDINHRISLFLRSSICYLRGTSLL